MMSKYMVTKGFRSMQEELLTADDVAQVLNISRSKAYIIMREKKIPTITIGKNVRVKSEDLDTFITANREYYGDDNENYK